MRLALLGYYHETNTFAATPTTYDRFEIARGEEIAARYGASTTTAAGFLAAASDGAGGGERVEVVPLLFANATPSGLIPAETYARLTGELLTLLETHGPWDGVLLALHGAAVAEGTPDADGDFAARVRHVVGPGVPIGASLDLHANLSQSLISATTVTTLYRTNPHLDARDRAIECANLVIRAVRGEIHPVQALETPPLVVNIVRQFTGEEPMAGLYRDVEAALARPGILSASAVMGYPYADVPQMGMAFLAVADDDAGAARETARWLARRAWARRAEYVGDVPSPEEAIQHALAAPRGPVVLLDVGDNVGAGSPADSTVLLHAARQQGARSFLQSLYDPAAAAACIAVGIGATLTLAVGGKTDDQHGTPVAITGRVERISDGQWEEPRPTHGGFRFYDTGPTAVLETDAGYTLVLTSKPVGNTSIEQMYTLGIRPEGYKIVVAKGVHSPRPAYTPIAAEILMVATPGLTSADLSLFSYRHRRRPLYPFEMDAVYE